jgi:hypothetical protein
MPLTARDFSHRKAFRMEPVDQQPEATMDKNQLYGQSKYANRGGMFERYRRCPSLSAMLLGSLAVSTRAKLFLCFLASSTLDVASILLFPIKRYNLILDRYLLVLVVIIVTWLF